MRAAYSFNFAGELDARNVLWITRWRRITSHALQDVRAIQSSGVHANPDAIEGCAGRIGDFANFEAFNAAV